MDGPGYSIAGTDECTPERDCSFRRILCFVCDFFCVFCGFFFFGFFCFLVLVFTPTPPRPPPPPTSPPPPAHPRTPPPPAPPHFPPHPPPTSNCRQSTIPLITGCYRIQTRQLPRNPLALEIFTREARIALTRIEFDGRFASPTTLSLLLTFIFHPQPSNAEAAPISTRIRFSQAGVVKPELPTDRLSSHEYRCA